MPRRRTAPETLPAWRLALLGPARLERADKTHGLERLSAALVAYLALEGPTPRARLSGLLWPDRVEDVARANLRQRLKRLRDALGADLISGEETLRLPPDLEVDAVLLESLVFTGEHARALALEGEFMLGHDYADCVELQAWVEATRAQIRGAQLEAFEAEAARCERAGELGAAMALCERLLELDPYLEAAHRRAMRLRYLSGDRAGALRAYARCRDLLERDLNVQPMLETRDLAALIERGEVTPPAPSASPRPNLPLSILRPPVLVARGGEWGKLEAAWEARKTVFLVGEAGVGKTRLMLDFAASKGEFVLNGARSGDADIPYSTFTRGLRAGFAKAGPFTALPPPWVRRELLRLVPEMAGTFELEPPGPITTPEESVRFMDAVVEVTRRAARGWTAFVSDDLHLFDVASFELRLYQTQRLSELEDHPIRSLAAYRRGLLPPALETVVARLLEADEAVLIELSALQPQEVQTFMRELHLPGLERLAPAMTRYTGGNPMFVLETLKHLFETDALERGLPEHLPPPGRIGPLVRQRLERLSPGALRLARVAAVAGADFDPALAAHLLEVNALDLADGVSELEAAQVMIGNAFAHDLIFEATLADVPRTVRALLHRRVAEHLERAKAPPARVAQHWLEGGDEERAAPWLLEAGRGARDAFRFPEAISAFERAATILRGQGRDEEAFEALHAVGEMLSRDDIGARLESVTQRLLDLARTPQARARAHSSRAGWLSAWGRYAEAEAVARAGLKHAAEADNPELQSDLASRLAETLWEQGNREAATAMLIEVCAADERLGPSVQLVESLNNVGFALATLSRYAEAQTYYERADEMAVRVGARLRRVSLQVNLSFNQRVLGLAARALETLQAAHAQALELSGAADDLRRNLHMQGATLVTLESYSLALERLSEALEISRAHALPHGFVLGDLARLYLRLGDFEKCAAHLEAAEAQPALRDITRSGLLRVRTELERARGLNPPPSLEAARAVLGAKATVDHRLRLDLLGSQALEPGVALGVSRAALRQAQEFGLGGIQIDANVQMARAWLRAGQAAEALQPASDAVTLLETFTPDGLERTEVLLVYARALRANQHPEARAAFECALAWVLETADARVPPEFRASFLMQNPVNAALLEAAIEAGLEVTE